jgi:uncharacterized protein (TIGR02147 family)
MQKVFRYLDFRQFLADYYLEKKGATTFFSYRYFSKKAGIKSPVFLKLVIDGKRNLTNAMIDKFCFALDLGKRETLFFRNLVLFNQARSPDEKQNYYSYLLPMMTSVDERQLTADQYRFYAKWYNSIIRELVCLHDFKDEYALIARMVLPPIKPSEARESIELMLRLGLICKGADGRYAQTDKAVTSGYDMVSAARREFNLAMVSLAKEAGIALTADKRSITGITIGISPTCYQVLLVELDAFKKRVISIVNNDEKSSQVYQFNFQLFPLSLDVANLEKKEEMP